mgnify:CR=1 FL=1
MPVFQLRCLALLLLVFVLAGCATRPPSIDNTLRASQIDSRLHQQHQAQLAQISMFQLTGQVAFFDDAEGNRDSGRYSWNHGKDTTSFRLFHQLGGTLARIEQDLSESRFIDRQGNVYRGDDLTTLLWQHTGMIIPFELLQSAILGQQPDVRLSQQLWYPDGTLAYYQASYPTWSGGEERWQVLLGDYQLVTTNGTSVLLPHFIEAKQNQLRVRMTVSRWRDVQQLSQTSDHGVAD